MSSHTLKVAIRLNVMKAPTPVTFWQTITNFSATLFGYAIGNKMQALGFWLSGNGMRFLGGLVMVRGCSLLGEASHHHNRGAKFRVEMYDTCHNIKPKFPFK